MGYLTTFQGVFPDTLFNHAGKFIFKNFTRLLIPATRKGDNVTLDTENPQEEEFAVGAQTPLSYYYFWMFPRKADEYYAKALRYEMVDHKKTYQWLENYRLLITKSLKNTGRKRYLSKNPPNTGRIPQLLKMFPNARFIFIHRNPVLVYLSTTHFFNVMMPHLQLQSFNNQEREELVLKIYNRIMKDYLNDQKLIPEDNKVEVSFDELEKNPLETLKNIYSSLNISGYIEAEQRFTAYLNKMKSYQKNRHSIHRSKLNTILERWGFAMSHWDYKIPENIDIIED
jgi:hypothetical protein